MSEQSLPVPAGRNVAWLAFFALILLAWLGILATVRPDLSGAPGHALAGHVHDGGYLVLLAMWGVMMLAMMLPTLVPTLLVLDGLVASARAVWIGLVIGYGAVWLVGAVGFSALQVLVARFGALDIDGALAPVWTSGALLLLAGGWQFSRTKLICQDACLSPMAYFVGRWRPGFRGGARMGAEIGMTCVGCCWAIMALGFVGGVMNLWWMGLATLFMVGEKLPDIGAYVRRPAGLVLLGAGLIVLATAASGV